MMKIKLMECHAVELTKDSDVLIMKQESLIEQLSPAQKSLLKLRKERNYESKRGCHQRSE